MQLEVPLPRVWFVSADKRSIVQLQQDRMHLNWRRLDDLSVGGGYVRFPAIQAEYLKIWSSLSRFVETRLQQPLQAVTAELTYVNLISFPGAQSAFEVAEATLVDFAWSENRQLPRPRGFSMAYSIELNGGADNLQVIAQTAKSKSDGKEVVKLDLTVKSKRPHKDSFEQWSSTAHDALVNAFKELTKPSMHRHWRLKET